MTEDKWIIGNWKMNLERETAKSLIQSINSAFASKLPSAKIVICPPFVLLDPVKNELNSLNNNYIEIGAQDCHFKKSGAYTGDVSASMLINIGCKYVILGHSERRKNHFETNYLVKKKAAAALAEGLTPIICVGESEKEREEGKVNEVINKQVMFSMPEDFTPENTIIAYEPVWAIGASVTPTVVEIEEVVANIREAVKCLKNKETADKITVLYGGSINGSNAKEIFNADGVDGGLIGGASLKAEEFINIINSTNKGKN